MESLHYYKTIMDFLEGRHHNCHVWKIQKNWCTVTVAPTIEHHGGHSRTPGNQRWDQVPGRSIITRGRAYLIMCTCKRVHWSIMVHRKNVAKQINREYEYGWNGSSVEEPFQPYSDSLHSYTWKEDDDTIHLRRNREYVETEIHMYVLVSKDSIYCWIHTCKTR